MWRSVIQVILLLVLAASGSAQNLFGTRIDYAIGDSPYCVFSIDFNGDGNCDLATANYGSDNVAILLGNGDGTFRRAGSSTAGHGPRSVFSIEVNGA